MKNNTQNMTAGNPLKLIFGLAIPLMLGNVFQQLYTVVDTIVVGKVLGINALAALGSADWCNWLVLSAIQGFAQGFAIKMAQEFGADDVPALKNTVGNSCVMALLLAIVFAAASLIAIPGLLKIQNTPAEIQPLSASYLYIMFSSIPVIMAFNLMSGMLRTLGDGKTPLKAMIVASITNIALDCLFVIGFGWGIPGAAIATVISQCVSSAICLMALKRVPMVHPSRSDLKPDIAKCVHLVRLGLPMALQNIVIAVGGIVVSSVVNTFGVIFIAGYTATNKLYGILEIAATSYGYAMTTYAGQNLGAKKYDRIRSGVKAGVISAVITSMVIGLAMIIFGKPVLSCFISGSKEEIDATLAVAYRFLVLMSVCLPILYVLHVVRSALQGMGNTISTMYSGGAELVMRVLCAIALTKIAFIGADGVFWAEVLAWLGADFVLIPSYFHEIRKYIPKHRKEAA